MKSTANYEPFICGADTEDDGAGNVTLYCMVHERGSIWSRDRDTFLHRILSLRDGVGERAIQIWCTNLEYDLVNIFGPDRISSVNLRFGKSYLVSAVWEGITFYDTVRHVPESVRRLGELIGLPKLERDDSVGYCIRDATITYRFAKQLSDIYGEIGCKMRSTLASTAYHLWAERYFDRKVSVVADAIRDFGRIAYHGGRTEAFAIGEYENVSVIDVASMFPWAMVQGDFPIPWGAIERCDDLARTDLALARVNSDLSPGVLPFRTRGGTVYPVGTWESWYVGEELRHAAKCGAEIGIKLGYRFPERCRPFDGYVSDMFARKNSARGVLRTVYKLLQNSLYGKFGQGGGRIVCTPLAKWEAQGKPFEDDARVWNGLVLYPVEADPPPWGNNVWAAIVTARARIRLYDEIRAIQESGADVYYCDTDSVFFSGGKRRYAAKARKPGDFELRGVFPELLIVGKKEYGLRIDSETWRFYAKGIPESARGEYLRKGEATFYRPNRLRESARTGNRANVWRERTKRRGDPSVQRTRKPSGFLNPVCVRNGILLEGE